MEVEISVQFEEGIVWPKKGSKVLVSVFEAFHQQSNMLLQSGLRLSKSNFVISMSLQVKFGH